MKSLVEFILEDRQYFNPSISLEEVQNLFKNIIKFIEDDVPLKKDTIDLIDSIKPSRLDVEDVINLIVDYYYSASGMNGDFQINKCQDFLDLVRKQPLSRIENILGIGAEGMVIDMGNNKVMKLLLNVQDPARQAQLTKEYKQMIGKNFQTLPKIYKVTDNYIIREDIIPDTPKCREYYKIATTKYEELKDLGYTMERGIARGKVYDVSLVVPKTKKVQEVRKWLVQLRTEFKSIGHNLVVNFGDFKPANLGETKDGRIVYFDW